MGEERLLPQEDYKFPVVDYMFNLKLDKEKIDNISGPKLLPLGYMEIIPTKQDWDIQITQHRPMRMNGNACLTLLLDINFHELFTRIMGDQLEMQLPIEGYIKIRTSKTNRKMGVLVPANKPLIMAIASRL